MKVFMPLYSIGAWGGFGLYHPGRSKYTHPAAHYPIAVYLPVVLDPYFHLYGYYYQRRRTWHGRVWAAHKYTKPTNPQSTSQQTWRSVFANGVTAWHNLTPEEKAEYDKLKYPIHMSGFNRFMHYYLREHWPPVPPPPLIPLRAKVFLFIGAH